MMSAIAPPLSLEKKSTTVRSHYARVPAFIRTTFQIGSRLLPSAAAAAAEYIFFRPHLRSSKVPAAPAKRRVRVDGEEIATYSWGESGPAVLLLHGWGGAAAQMAPLAWALAADGRRVVAIDLPAHGQSTGAHTSLPEVAHVIGELATQLGPFGAVVGHSFGAVAAMVVARKLGTERVVTIGGPASLGFVVDSFAVAIGLEGEAQRRFHQRLERRFGPELWHQFSPRELATHIEAPALIVHDQDDSAVPVEQSQALAAVWPGARLFTTTGLGHYRVLRSPEVHRTVCRFLHPGGLP